MRYDQNDRESSNVEDRRGEGGGGFRFPGGGIQIPIGGGGMSLTTLLIIGAVMLLLGINPLDMLFGTGGRINMPDLPRTERPTTREGTPSNIPGLPGSPQNQAGGEDQEKAFISRVLADTEDVWTSVFQEFRQNLHRSAVGALYGHHADSLRRRPGRDGAVLLSARQESLRRSRFL